MGMIPLDIYHDSSEVRVRSLAAITFTQMPVLCTEYVCTIYIYINTYMYTYGRCIQYVHIQRYTLRGPHDSPWFRDHASFDWPHVESLDNTIHDIWQDVDEHGGRTWLMFFGENGD